VRRRAPASATIDVVVVTRPRPAWSIEEVGMAGLSVSMVTEHGGHRVLVSLDGTQFETPPIEHIAFYIGLGALVAVNVVDPPVAVALTVGHLLIDFTRRPGLRALGEALDEA
jgi:hypothetical protein